MVTEKKGSYNIFVAQCPSRRVLELIANQWTALVFYALEDAAAPVRFGQLLGRIDGISRKMLSQTLHAMERDGLVKRTVYPVVPPQVDYSLTELGQSLSEPIKALSTWAYDHIEQVIEARATYDQRDHKSIQDATASLVELRGVNE